MALVPIRALAAENHACGSARPLHNRPLIDSAAGSITLDPAAAQKNVI
jgi:hypothetical protein